MRVYEHPILGPSEGQQLVTIEVDGKRIEAFEGEPIAAALLAAGVVVCRETPKRDEPRGVFCAVGLCIDCMMTVDGKSNTRVCVTPVRNGMVVETQKGLGKWSSQNG